MKTYRKKRIKRTRKGGFTTPFNKTSRVPIAHTKRVPIDTQVPIAHYYSEPYNENSILQEKEHLNDETNSEPIMAKYTRYPLASIKITRNHELPPSGISYLKDDRNFDKEDYYHYISLIDPIIPNKSLGRKLNNSLNSVIIPKITWNIHFDDFIKVFEEMKSILKKKYIFDMRKTCEECIYVYKKTFDMISKLNIDSLPEFIRTLSEVFSKQLKKFYLRSYRKYLILAEFHDLIYSIVFFIQQNTYGINYYINQKNDIGLVTAESMLKNKDAASIKDAALVNEDDETECLGSYAISDKDITFQCEPINEDDKVDEERYYKARKIIENSWETPTYFECPFDEEYLKTRRKCKNHLNS